MSVIVNDFSGIIRYLNGDDFLDNFAMDYQNTGHVRYRNDVLVDICRGARVLHVGCCDHVPLIRTKIDKGEWLHGQLSAVASETLGVDIDREAVDAANTISGLGNIVCGDLTSTHKIAAVADRQFDYAVFGEVLEHIGNPVAFLTAFQRNYKTNVKNIIITVPNAFRAGNLKAIFKNREVINTDHRFFFTPYTIAKVVVDAGITPLRIMMATFSKKSSFQHTILNRWPLLAEDIILFGTNEVALPQHSAPVLKAEAKLPA